MAHSSTSHITKPSLSIVVPAFNEDQNIADTVQSIHKAMEGRIQEYEILIVNDGSQDDTGIIADTLATKDARLEVIHNPHNVGYGFSVLRGAAAARLDYVQLVPGDNEIPTQSIAAIADKIGSADMVIPYMMNFRVRAPKRKAVSWGFTTMLNVLFAMSLHYYNGPCAIRRDLIETTAVKTRGFAFLACILIQLIKREHTYVEVGIMLEPRKFGKSTMLSAKNLASVVKTIAWLFWHVNITRRLRRTQYRPSHTYVA